MERLTVQCLVCTNCGVGDQCKVCQYVSVSYVVGFTSPCPIWYMYIVFYMDTPYSGNSSVSEPHNRNVNVSEPHSGDVNVSEPTVECSVSVGYVLCVKCELCTGCGYTNLHKVL